MGSRTLGPVGARVRTCRGHAMHEAAIAENIIRTVEDLIDRGEVAGEVKSVNLRVGRLTAVIPENLRFLFTVLAEGSALEGAELQIECVPIRCRCRPCGSEFEVSEVYFSCPQCHSPEVDIMTGRELMIEAVEVA